MHTRNQNQSGSEFDDLESRSLNQYAKKEGVRQFYRTMQLVAFFALTFGVIIMIKREEISSMLLSDDTKTIDVKTIKRISVATLKTMLIEPMKNYDTLLQNQYGKYRHDAFNKSAIFQQIFSPSSLSTERLKRRMKIKIIQAALSPPSGNSNSSDIHPVVFTWVVGGHSAAAGHGDLFNQTHAAVLERVARPAFAALGIEFRGKNYAMGGTNSAPEVAMCMNEIFGMDMDVLSWDFGMTDGRNHPYLYEMYANRAGVHPTTPSIFAFGGYGFDRLHESHEAAGMSTFDVNADLGFMPDSSVVDPMELPPGVRYLSCGGHIESGEPCTDYKWDTVTSCPDPGVKYQTSWHTGWKYHQHRGHLLAGFMVENLIDALNELDVADVNIRNESEVTDEAVAPDISESYLKYLLSLEARDKDTFLASALPRNFPALKDTELNKIFHRSYAVCNTALLPSQARYDGLVTESGKVSKYLNGGRSTYIDEGYRESELPVPRGDDVPNPFWLAFKQATRNICEYAEIDFKDFFIARAEDNWMSMLVPNDSVMKMLNSGDDSRRPTLGVVMLCTLVFDWNRFPKDYVFLHNITDTTSTRGEIVVNDVIVTGSTIVYSDRCHVLSHEGGYHFPQSSSGQYEIKIQISGFSGGRVYISSVIVL